MIVRLTIDIINNDASKPPAYDNSMYAGKTEPVTHRKNGRWNGAMGELEYSRGSRTCKLLIFQDAKNAQNGRIAPNWNVSGTRTFTFCLHKLRHAFATTCKIFHVFSKWDEQFTQQIQSDKRLLDRIW